MDIGDWFMNAAFEGSLLLAIPVAVIAGLVSFFSPCVVPLLPGYLSYATGLAGAELGSGRRSRMFLGSVLFVLGFSFVFVSFGALFGQLGDWLLVYTRQISIVLGIVTILVGLAFMGFVPWLQRDVRVHKVPAVGLAAAPLLGALFGLGWTPRIGPTLTAITSLALNEASAGRQPHGRHLVHADVPLQPGDESHEGEAHEDRDDAQDDADLTGVDEEPVTELPL